MNMIKKTDGFTLVELIVVIAILAILAAIAVPAYSGYISKANEAADITQLDAIKTAATFAAMEKNPEKTVEKIVVTIDATTGTKVDVTVGTGADAETFNNLAIQTYFDAASLKSLKSGKTVATWVRVADDAADLAEGWNIGK